MKKIMTILVLIVVVGTTVWSTSQVAPAHADAMQMYIVLYKQHAVPADATKVIAKAGGTLVYSYDQIGVVIARSDNASFRGKLLKDKRIEGATSTAGFGVPLYDKLLADEGADASSVDMSNMSANGEPLWGLQWDMRQIHVPEAHSITTGSPSVIAGIIDSGIDYTHVDLIPNLDWDKSVSCIGGVPDQDPAAWDDWYGHGTHVAGTVAAAANGIGIVGIAPDVKIASIKGCGDDGYCWPEAIVCSFMWAAEHQMDVTNNSYFVDPYEFNCHNDPEQHAIWKAVQRAVRYAQSQGVAVISSAGNSNVDLTHHEEITNACNDLPVELSGVIGVSANGNLMQKSFYSSYGVGAVEVVAPGGDSLFQVTDEAVNGRVLSTIPADSFLATVLPHLVVEDCSVSPCVTYMYLQGTSMSSPHATGVAALIISQYGKMPPGWVQAMLTQTADPQPCPPDPFDPDGSGAWLAHCQGGSGYNSFYGHGQVNAFNAVTHTSGNK